MDIRVYMLFTMSFSKYLEANITEASLSDTKTLQDFAEKCNRQWCDSTSLNAHFP